MKEIAHALVVCFGSNQMLGILIDGWLKGVLLLAITWLTLALWRRRAAATRHLIWSLAIATLLLLPILSLVLPAWRLRVLPPVTIAPPAFGELVPRPATSAAPVEPIGTPASSYRASLTLADESLPVEGWSEAPPSVVPPAKSVAPLVQFKPGRQARFGWEQWLLGGWMLVGGMLGLRWVVGFLVLQRLRRLSQPLASAEWTTLADSLCGQLGLSRHVELRQSARLAMPITWGCWRPVLLLPDAANDWSLDWRRAVLCHELAHVKRWDCLTQALAQLACGLHWPNPLVWLAAHRLRLERERACDDLVLGAGSKPSDYAEQLLELANQLIPHRLVAPVAIAVARRSSLEGRLLAILDKTRNRRGLNSRFVWASFVCMIGIAAPMAALRLSEKGGRAAGPEKAGGTMTNRHDKPVDFPQLAAGSNRVSTTDAKATSQPGRAMRSAERQLSQILDDKLLKAKLRYGHLEVHLTEDSTATQVLVSHLRAVKQVNGQTEEAPLNGAFTIQRTPGGRLYDVSGQGDLAHLQFMVWIDPPPPGAELNPESLVGVERYVDAGPGLALSLQSSTKATRRAKRIGPLEVFDARPEWLDTNQVKLKLEPPMGGWSPGYKIATAKVVPRPKNGSSPPIVTDKATLVLKNVPAYVMEGGLLVRTQVPVFVSAAGSPVLFGRVVDKRGQPLEKVAAVLCTPQAPITIRNGEVVSQPKRASEQAARGRATTRVTSGLSNLAVISIHEFTTNALFLHEEGFAWLPALDLGSTPQITLFPWGRIVGRLFIGQRPGQHKTIRLNPAERSHSYDQCVRYDDEAETDAEGRFTLERVPPGWIELGYEVAINSRSSTLTSRIAVKVEGGKTTEVTIGGGGRTVMGRLAAGNASIDPLDFDGGDERLLLPNPPGATWPIVYADAQLHDPQFRAFAFRVQPDGTFRIEDVPAGDYFISVDLERPPEGGRAPKRIYLHPFRWEVRVPPAPQGPGVAPVDVGQLKLDIQNLIFPPAKHAN